MRSNTVSVYCVTQMYDTWYRYQGRWDPLPQTRRDGRIVDEMLRHFERCPTDRIQTTQLEWFVSADRLRLMEALPRVYPRDDEAARAKIVELLADLIV